ncbi:MAG: hypothetical protein HYV09_32595 [Deltaproteobacteria bacterium]|nr:hypothetical protein [Deltaproteobacteria bacterium]
MIRSESAPGDVAWRREGAPRRMAAVRPAVTRSKASAARRLGLVALLAVLSGCQREAPPPPATPEAASAAVTRFFASLERRDCQGLTNEAGGKLREKIAAMGCDAMFEKDPLATTRLRSIGRVERDGRASDAFLLQLVLERQGAVIEGQARVERVGRTLRLVVL